MQISKSFLVVCAAAFCAVLIPLRAADTDLQNKLQEALDKKLNELQTQPPAAAPQPAVPTPKPKKRPAPAAAPAPAAQPPAAVAQPAPAPTPTPAAQPAPPVEKPAPAPAIQSTPQPAIVGPTPVDAATIAKAREALRQKMQQLEPQPPAPAGAAASAPAMAKPGQPATKPEAKPTAVQAPKKPAKMQGALAFPPIQGPPPAVSADKQQRLTELLRKYKAEEITPEEYHLQRAKIMSEP